MCLTITVIVVERKSDENSTPIYTHILTPTHTHILTSTYTHILTPTYTPIPSSHPHFINSCTHPHNITHMHTDSADMPATYGDVAVSSDKLLPKLAVS